MLFVKNYSQTPSEARETLQHYLKLSVNAQYEIGFGDAMKSV